MRDKLVARLNTCGYKGEVDFLYLPIDFRTANSECVPGCIRRNRCNVGYCFLNFRTSAALVRFREEFHGQQSPLAKQSSDEISEGGDKLPGFNSKKVLEVSPARVQGLHPNIVRLQGSPIMAKASLEREWRPGCTPTRDLRGLIELAIVQHENAMIEWLANRRRWRHLAEVTNLAGSHRQNLGLPHGHVAGVVFPNIP